MEYWSIWRTALTRLFGMHSPFRALPWRGRTARLSGRSRHLRQRQYGVVGRLSLDVARAIALKGGVVGLWSLAPDIGKSVEAYGDRMLELAEWLGEDHVAFGTDINGLGPFGTLSGYADLRRVVDYWQHQGVDETRIAQTFNRQLRTSTAGCIQCRPEMIQLSRNGRRVPGSRLMAAAQFPNQAVPLPAGAR